MRARQARVLAGWRSARRLQIIYGLLCDKPGRPIAVEVFSGELHDDKTLPAQIAKLKGRFGLSRVVVVSDRGMVTKSNIELLSERQGRVDYRAESAADPEAGAGRRLQLSLFDEANLAEITSEDYPGERLVVCRNPLSQPSARANARNCWTRPSAALRDRPARRARHSGRRRSDRACRRSGAQALQGQKAL